MFFQQALALIEIAVVCYSGAKMLLGYKFFKWPEGGARPPSAVGLACLTTLMVGNGIYFYHMLLQAYRNQIPIPQLLIAGALQLTAHAGWRWALRTVGRNTLTVALSGDIPTFLLSHGPYAYVRHPFYTVYLLCNAAASVLANRSYGYLVLLGFYIQAQAFARLEEEKFRRSPLANEYSSYQSQTPRFFVGNF